MVDMKQAMGRRARRGWRWLIVFAVIVAIYVGWFVPNYGWGLDLVAAVLPFVFELFFVMLLGIMQFVAIFWFMGRARVYWLGPGESGVTFADYRGNREILDLAGRVVTLLRGVKQFKEMGGEVPRGLLLVGPPGTGKSYLAQAIATEAGVPFCYASAPSFQNMFFGVGNLRVMQIYAAARKKAREHGAAIVFIDEIDAIGMSRSGQMGAGAMGFFGGGLGLLNELLLQMDPPAIDHTWWGRLLRMFGLRRGKAVTYPVLTVGATNLPDVLDPALLRPGRFDQKLTIDPPDMVGRIDIVRYYLDKTKHAPEFPVERAAGDTIGYTPVMIKHVINEAAVFAHFSGRDHVTYADFTAAREGYEWGLRQPILSMSAEDRRRLAYHEAGHAAAQYLLLPKDRMVKVTIVRHGQALGLSATKPIEERYTRSEEEIRTDIRCALASRAAEEIFLDMKLSGVVEDLTQATRMAAVAIGWLGMDGSLYSYRAFDQNVPDGSAKRRIERMLDQEYRAVKALLEANRPFVEAIAEGLMQRDELTGDEVGELAARTEAVPIGQA
jgi:cell division protease FtsH